MYRAEQSHQQPPPPVFQPNGHHPQPHQEYDTKYDPSTATEYPYPPHPSAPSAMSAYPRPAPQPQAQPDLTPKSSKAGNRFYSLVVAQQPDRARMCGFGDKDRRPITPPPCIRLMIQDATTGREIEYAEIDAQHFILQVDLWDENGASAVNCVQHSNTSPSVSISMATTTSYPPQPDQTHSFMSLHGIPGGQQQYLHPQAAPNAYYHGSVQGYAFPGGQPGHMVPSVTSAGGNYTRNLIGSCSVSAAQLADTEDRVGFWFVLQDLSVRTEGSFRLKFSFINVGLPDGGLNANCAPVLATAFSEVFTVWSAKKFPGVKESTALSKCFATQGVKIPIRKDGGGKGGGSAAGGAGEFDGDDD